ncbi:MAG: FxsA family protein [Marivibrio sp.]|uniref:FxsA family protein n=1 Tax=Marivibrio sp. TaxID=2039719 RepID=UPI0032EE01B9
MPVLLLLFIAVPIAEIALFIEIGDVIGLWPTLATIVVTALVGATLVRQQGVAALNRAQAALAEDRFPVEEVVTGVCLLIAGALLLTPGFLTDAIGFSLLIPPLRQAIGGALIRQAAKSKRFTVRTEGPGAARGPGSGPRRGPDGRPIIDGEFEEVDPERDRAGERPPLDEGRPRGDGEEPPR